MRSDNFFDPNFFPTVKNQAPTYRTDNDWTLQELKNFFIKCFTRIIHLKFWLPSEEKSQIEPWLMKLSEMYETKDEEIAKLRNDYAWFLLIQVEIGSFSEPFNDPPPDQLTSYVDILVHIFLRLIKYFN